MSEEVVVLRAPARFTLDELAERMREPLEAAGAERAIVFGSWARGEADGYSDLDLVVVVQTELPRFERGMSKQLDVFDAIAREGVTIHEGRTG